MYYCIAERNSENWDNGRYDLLPKLYDSLDEVYEAMEQIAYERQTHHYKSVVNVYDDSCELVDPWHQEIIATWCVYIVRTW